MEIRPASSADSVEIGPGHGIGRRVLAGAIGAALTACAAGVQAQGTIVPTPTRPSPALPSADPPTRPGATPGTPSDPFGGTRAPAAAAGDGGDTRSLVIQPGVGARYTWSDNIDLRPKGLEKPGSIVEIYPFVRAEYAGAAGFGYLNYQLRGLKYYGSDFFDHDVRNDLRATGDASIAGDLLRVSALAQVFDVNRTPFGVGSFDAAGRTLDRTTYKRFDVSPYSYGRPTESTEFVLRYRLTYSDPGSSYASNVGNILSGELGSIAGRGRWGWLARVESAQYSYDNDFDYRNSIGELFALYAPLTTLQLGAGVNYSTSNVLVDSDGKDAGFGPSLRAAWNPDQATLLSTRWSKTYYSDQVQIQGSRTEGRMRFGATFDKGVRDGNQATILYYDPLRLFSIRNPYGAAPVGGSASIRTSPGYVDLGSAAGAPLIGSGLQSPLLEVEALVVTAEYVGVRNGMLATVFVNNQRSPIAVPGFSARPGVDQRGLLARYSFRVDPRNIVALDGRYQLSDAIDASGTSTLTSVGLEWRSQVTRQLTSTVVARATRQRGTGTTPEYDERGLGAGFEYRF